MVRSCAISTGPFLMKPHSMCLGPMCILLTVAKIQSDSKRYSFWVELSAYPWTTAKFNHLSVRDLWRCSKALGALALSE